MNKKQQKFIFNDLFSVQWHITHRCNLNCFHCYRQGEKDEPDLNKLLEIFDKIEEFIQEGVYRNYGFADTSPVVAPFGVLPERESIIEKILIPEEIDSFSAGHALVGKGAGVRFHIAGGEPTASPHLIPILKTIEEKGYKIRLLTNGTLITPSLAEKLSEINHLYIQISLEGRKETHEKIRGKNSFQRAVEGAGLLSSRGMEVTFAMVISDVNIDDINYIGEMAEGIARRVYYSRLVPIHEKHFDHMLTPQQWLKTMKKIAGMTGVGSTGENRRNGGIEKGREDKKIEIPMRDPTFRPLFLSPYKALHCPGVGGCSIGYNSVAIECNGDVYPCRRLPIIIGNIFKDTLKNIWRSPILDKIRDRNNLKGKCGSCSYKLLCGGCRGVAFALTGDYLEEDPQCPYSPLYLHPLFTLLPQGKKRQAY